VVKQGCHPAIESQRNHECGAALCDRQGIGALCAPYLRNGALGRCSPPSDNVKKMDYPGTAKRNEYVASSTCAGSV